MHDRILTGCRWFRLAIVGSLTLTSIDRDVRALERQNIVLIRTRKNQGAAPSAPEMKIGP